MVKKTRFSEKTHLAKYSTWEYVKQVLLPTDRHRSQSNQQTMAPPRRAAKVTLKATGGTTTRHYDGDGRHDNGDGRYDDADESDG